MIQIHCSGTLNWLGEDMKLTRFGCVFCAFDFVVDSPVSSELDFYVSMATLRLLGEVVFPCCVSLLVKNGSVYRTLVSFIHFL